MLAKESLLYVSKRNHEAFIGVNLHESRKSPNGQKGIPEKSRIFPKGSTVLKNKRITIQLDDESRIAIEERAGKANMSISAYVRDCINQSLKTPEHSPNNSGVFTEESPKFSEQIPADIFAEELKTKNNQIEKLQSALDQSQQLHAMSEQRHESKLAQIEGRSFLQRLKAVLVANP